MTTVTEHRLRRLFADRGYRVHQIRRNRNYWVQVERESGSPRFFVSAAATPSDFRFEYGSEKTTFDLAPNQWRDFVETVNAADAEMIEQSFPGH
jgi:hypothetical protein